jgi:uncharacterized protein YegL
MQFKIESFLNHNLPAGGTRVDVVFSLSADGAGPAQAARPHRVIGLLGDRSGSMAGPKMTALKHALRVAIDAMDEDTEFFVTAFDTRERNIVPLTRADAAGKRFAHGEVQRLEAGGGTAMSTALQAARSAFQQRPGAVCQAILLTDGQNGPEDVWPLDQALTACAGLFQAHCRGVGTDWSPKELRQIADRLLGTAQMVAQPDGMAEDFRATMAAAMALGVADVRLRLWMPKNARLTGFKQGYPTEIDLLGSLRPVDQRAVDLPLGAFGEGTQDYSASFTVVPLATGEQMLVCRPSIVTPDPATRQDTAMPGANVTVTWTDDANLSARIGAQVAHYSGQAEKARAIQEGLEAMERRDDGTATLRLGRALQLAQQSGDEETTRRLRQVVDVLDEAAGTVRLRRGAEKAAVMDLDVGSTRTVRVRRD